MCGKDVEDKGCIQKSSGEISCEVWWKDNIKMDFQEIGYKDRNWMELAQNRTQWCSLVLALPKLGSCYHSVLNNLDECNACLAHATCGLNVGRHWLFCPTSAVAPLYLR
jgi:hypothetical protein